MVADALSRCSELPSTSCFILSMPHFVFLEDLYKELQSHNDFITLREKIQANPADYPDHVLTPNFVLHRGRIWLPSDCTFIKALLTKFHQTPTGGHMGFRKTLNRIAENFTWQTMSNDIHKFVAQSVDCQLVKYEPAKPRGLLCPLPVPGQPWEDLSMDFIVGLPTYRGNTCILVIIDRYSKGLHLGMLPSCHTAQTVAQLFMELVGKLHDMPRSIISDRDPLFIRKFWQALFRLSGTKLRMSFAYHPQTDGQTEVANRIIEQYLRAFVHRKPNSWGRFLLWVEWSYNTSTHSSTGMTPFEVTFGQKPPTLPQCVSGTTTLDTVDDLLSQREAVFTLLRQKLLKAQTWMKAIANGHRRDHEFQIGEWVLVRLRPYRQTTASGAVHSKLARRFYGPFQVTEKMGPVAYKLALPEHSRIHPVFHCSNLKPFWGSAPLDVAAELPQSVVDNQPVSTPLAILAHKTIPSKSGPKHLVLVKWKGLDLDKTSWEEWTVLQAMHHLEDKVVFEGRRNDMNSRAGVQAERPKRQSIAPMHLKDYVTT